MIIENKTNPGFFFVQSSAKKVFPVQRSSRFSLAHATFTALIIIGIFSFFAVDFNKVPDILNFKNRSATTIIKPVANQPISINQPISTNQSIAINQPETDKIVEKKDNSIDVTGLVIEPIITSRPEHKPMNNSIPEFYGSLKIPKDQTLCNIIETVYGSYKKLYLDKLLKVNLSIENPDKIYAGVTIDLPVIIGTYNEWKNDHACILFSQEKNLKKAFVMARKYHTKDMDIRILPGWDSKKGFLFSIVLDKPFLNLAQAVQYKEKLVGINDLDLICEKVSFFNEGRKIL